MPGPTTSLFWILVCVVLAPLLAGLVPRRRVPEVVLLLVLGVLIGPNVLALAGTDDAIAMLRQLGLGMLFLLAGYEIEVRDSPAAVAAGDVDVARVPGHRARRDLAAGPDRHDPRRGRGRDRADLHRAGHAAADPQGRRAARHRLGGTVLHHGAYGETSARSSRWRCCSAPEGRWPRHRPSGAEQHHARRSGPKVPGRRRRGAAPCRRAGLNRRAASVEVSASASVRPAAITAKRGAHTTTSSRSPHRSR